KFDVPLAVGVPEITPELGASVNPAGSAPLAIAHVYGGVPPLAARVAEYAAPTTPPGSAVVVIVSGPAATVSPVLPLTEPSVAEIVVLPVVTAVATPPELTVATLVFEEAHVTWLVRLWVLESEYVPVALNCCVAPTVSVGFAGVTAIDVSVGAACGLKTTS